MQREDGVKEQDKDGFLYTKMSVLQSCVIENRCVNYLVQRTLLQKFQQIKTACLPMVFKHPKEFSGRSINMSLKNRTILVFWSLLTTKNIHCLFQKKKGEMRNISIETYSKQD